MNLANKITIARIGLIPLFMLTLQHYPAWMVEGMPWLSQVNQYGSSLAVLIFLLASTTDKLDGYIARKYNQVTPLGKLLDPLADKLLISAALLMMVEQSMIPAWMAVVIIGREVVITGIRVLAAAKGIALAADRHGKLKMVLQVVAIAAVLLRNYPFAWMTSLPIDYMLMLVAVVLTVYSGYKYIANNYQALQLHKN
ncbi:CDP-diacylglycerol--glycerol-3-phosphate 3-phosphatidyltransferase [Paenibacillus guangzhouensis]|uniref:CDP-diacylglycerol--glycerol-3-phosphate 3-phosphatidyltransferase n=1 Tax=Paenibacillus guangzhouensis TaxID=1473112 RepID=UPI0012671503|nr:CDP-diacylglycerol--glycerol-3-phosphate 3-phosphatidyltransferase [Paenibacillus guangzhouensis]